MLNSFRDEELVKVQGKTYPVVGGRLRMAHNQNKLLSIETFIKFYNESSIVIQAKVKTEKGSFCGIGNASIKRDRILANAIIELAETRAIARALRFAGYGVEYTGYEEMGDNKNSNWDNDSDSTAVNSIDDTHSTTSSVSKSQLNTIFSMAQNINMSNDELRNVIKELTGKSYTKDLSNKDIDSIIGFLKEKELSPDIEAH